MMFKNFTKTTLKITACGALVALGGYFFLKTDGLTASSHREAPLISNDPVADNTDLYAFRSPDDTNSVTIIAAYVPAELPQGGPNYFSFGTNVRYEIHIKNDATTTGDDIRYRFAFTQVNEDPTTFFNIRLGAQNLKTSYICEKSVGGGAFTAIVTGGVVPPPNIGPRSIDTPGIGLGMPYSQLVTNAITTATSGETIYCGPSDDPFFVDLGGIFDLGQTRAGGTGIDAPKDGLRCKNVHVICIKQPIDMLQKDGKNTTQATSILDGDFTIGVWASASRPAMRVLNGDGTETHSGGMIQISRLGMPLTNEAVIPIGEKDRWNSASPYVQDTTFDNFAMNPELGLYMDDSLFGGAVPAFSALRIQRNAYTILGNVDFGNGKDGLNVIKGHPATNGTALDTVTGFGNYLLRPGKPRSVDLLPIFHTGVPNIAPYQLATGKTVGNPLSPGKPFINNFMPTFGDMLRLNMAVPVTPRNDPNFSSLGLVYAAVLGLTDPTYNSSTALQFIPNMDGFPNGRRLEDDVTRIELQAVGGVVLAAIGVFYDDYQGTGSPVTPNLLGVLGYTTGIESNDTSFSASFPYVQLPWSGYGLCTGGYVITSVGDDGLGVASPDLIMQTYPNPTSNTVTFKYRVASSMKVSLNIYDATGKLIATPIKNETRVKGMYEFQYNLNAYKAGVYVATLTDGGIVKQSSRLTVIK